MNWALRTYITTVILAGVTIAVTMPPSIDRPYLFFALFALTIVSSTFKVKVPIERGWASTSVSEAFPLAALFLLGANAPLGMAATGAALQTRVFSPIPQPWYRLLFNAGALVVTLAIVGVLYELAGGVPGGSLQALQLFPVVVAGTTYFLCNSGLVATAVAWSSEQSMLRVWRETLQWAAPTYYLSTAVAAITVVVVSTETYWLVALVALPLALGYRATRVYLQRLDEEQQRLAVILERLGDAVIATTPSGEVSLINAAAERLTGLPAAAALERPLGEVLWLVDRATREQRFDPVSHVGTHGQVPSVVPLAIREHGSGAFRPVDVSGNPLHPDRGGLVFVIRDMSAHVYVEQERFRVATLESLGVLAGGIAHDFNNLLSAILGQVGLIRTDPEATPAIVDEAQAAESACLRARSLTRQLLTFAHGGEPVLTVQRVEPLIRDTVLLAAAGSTVTTDFAVANHLWPVAVDPAQFERVIINLTLNACQAMPHGGRLRVSAVNSSVASDFSHTLPPPGDYVAIAIADDGVGITGEHLGRIFDAYYTTKVGGTGLGLATAHAIVRAHGGYITVRSTVGAGTEFTIFLPRAVEASATASTRATVHPQRVRVLVMDDESIVRDATANMVRRLGYACDTAGDGHEAIARVEAALSQGERFDVALLDLRVPGGMSGEEAAERLMRLDPMLRTVACSGYTRSTALSNPRDHGFTTALPKPFTIERLAEMLEAVSRPHSSH
jgi:PAS domain S-box-containing protein